jgi:hypothetical protein
MEAKLFPPTKRETGRGICLSPNLWAYPEHILLPNVNELNFFKRRFFNSSEVT